VTVSFAEAANRLLCIPSLILVSFVGPHLGLTKLRLVEFPSEYLFVYYIGYS